MRVLAAILFSALLVITQGLAAFLPGHRINPSACCGCNCTQRACCNTVPRSTNPPPQPLSAQRATGAAQVMARAPLAAQPPRPTCFLTASSPAPTGFLPSDPVPLFRRHCALLL